MHKKITIHNTSEYILTRLVFMVCILILILTSNSCSTSPDTELATSADSTITSTGGKIIPQKTGNEVVKEIRSAKSAPTSIPITITKSTTSTHNKTLGITAIPSPNTEKPTLSATVHPQPFGTLKLSVKQGFDSLDPHEESSQSFSAWGPGIVYERIMKFNNGEQASLPSMRTICDLCESWQIEDLTTFNFQFRNDHIWNYDSDLEPYKVTAYDIEYSFNRIKEKESQQAFNLNMMEEIDALSPTELIIELLAPDADFLKNIAHGNAKIISKHHTQYENNLTNRTPIGSGPWKVAKLSKGSMSYLDSNPTSVKKPLVNRIEFHVIPDSEVRLSSYLAGLIDIHNLETDATIQQNQFKGPTEIQLKEIRTGEGVEIIFNAKTPPFDIQEIRKLSFYSMNPASFNFTPDDPVVSFGFKVDNDSWMPQPTVWKEYFFDNSNSIEKEKPKPLTSITDKNVNIDVGNYGPNYLQSAEFVSNQLSNLGFKTNIQILNRPQYAAKALGKHSFQILVGPPIPHFTPNSYLISVFHSTGRFNSTGLQNDNLDELIEKQSMEHDQVERSELIKKINGILFDESHRFMPATKIKHWTWQNHVNNFFPNFTSNEYSFWESVSIEK